MLRRVGYVLLTYATRPLNWLTVFLAMFSTLPLVLGLFGRPSHSGNRLDTSNWLMIITLNFSLLLLLRSLMQLYFSQAGARLIPNYAIPHLIPIGFVWLLYVALNTASLQVAGVQFLAAVSLSLLPCGICCGCSLIRSPESSPPSSHAYWLMIPFFGLVLLSPLLEKLWVLFGTGSLVEQYFQGRQSVWSWAFIFGSVAATAAYVRRSLRLSVSYCELGCSSPLGLSLDAPSTWRKEVERQQIAPPSRVEERKLSSAINQASLPGWRSRSNLWRAGSPHSGIFATIASAAIPILPFAVLVWVQSDSNNIGGSGAGFSPTLLGVWAFFLITSPGASWAHSWRDRRKFLEIESLRPVARNTFANQIAVAIARDLAPVGINYLVWLTLFMIAVVPRQSFGEWLVTLLIFFVSLYVMTFAMCLWAIVIRRDWISFLVQLAIGSPLIVVLLRHLIQGEPELSDMLLRGAWKCGAGASIFGIFFCVMAWLAYRQWKTMEMASCSLSNE